MRAFRKCLLYQGRAQTEYKAANGVLMHMALKFDRRHSRCYAIVVALVSVLVQHLNTLPVADAAQLLTSLSQNANLFEYTSSQ